MTVKMYNELISNAQSKGVLISRKEMHSPFSCGDLVEEKVYQIDGYYVSFHDGKFFFMTDVNGNPIEKNQLSENEKFASMTTNNLQALIMAAQKELDIRRSSERKKAEKNFLEAWKILQTNFPEVFINIKINCEDQFHVAVDELKINFEK